MKAKLENKAKLTQKLKCKCTRTVLHYHPPRWSAATCLTGVGHVQLVERPVPSCPSLLISASASRSRCVRAAITKFKFLKSWSPVSAILRSLIFDARISNFKFSSPPAARMHARMRASDFARIDPRTSSISNFSITWLRTREIRAVHTSAIRNSLRFRRRQPWLSWPAD